MTDHYWPPEARTKHLYIPGVSGYGKTTLMANLAIQDIRETDDPIIAIDPKGSREGLVERILPFIPEQRVRDVVYLSLRKPVPIDLLSYRDPYEKSLVTADIIAILKRFSYGSWGPTMQGTLRKLIPTLLEAPDATFLDIGAFLESEKRRNQILDQVSDERKAYWRENKPSKADSGPLASRIANFEEEPLKTIAGARRGEGINIAELIDDNKIFLVDTSPLTEDGLILGALIMSRIQQAIFRRSPDREHRCCQVYADEFQNFVTSAFNVMLSQARSFNLSLCLANQHPKQITDIWDDITGCVSSYVMFRMEGTHAQMLRSKIKDPAFVPSPAAPENPFIRQKLDFLKQMEEEWRSRGDMHELAQASTKRAAYEAELDAEARAKNLKAPSYFDMIPQLAVGHAIYVAQDGTTHSIQTARLPAPPQPNFAKHITEATYAQYSENRTVDNSSSNSPQVRQDEVNGNNPPQDQPPSGPPPNVPSHRDKKANPRTSR
jgi:hypothetical protein